MATSTQNSDGTYTLSAPATKAPDYTAGPNTPLNSFNQSGTSGYTNPSFVKAGTVNGQDTGYWQGGNTFTYDTPPAVNAPTPSTTFDASSLSQTNPNIQFPTNAPSTQTGATTANALNSSIPTAQSIISNETAQTPAEATNTGLLGKLATLIGGQSSLATQQINNENAAGVPNLTKITNDLSTQLMGLNDQSTALQLAAAPGGTIQNQEQQNAQGRGVTAGGLAPITSADLRNNQIQQSTIAAQALTVKSAYYAANNNLTLAKDAADKAAQVAFDADTQKINYVKALIDANAPQMNKEEKAQTDLVQAQLQDRQNQIDQQKTDYTTGIGLINNAMKFNGQSPQAQLAIQAAQKIDPHDPMYLQKVGALLTQYQQDPIATQQALAQLALTKAQTAKIYQDASVSGQDPATVSGWVSSIKSGTAKLSDLTGNPALKNAVVTAMAAGGTSQSQILQTTQQSLKDLQAMVDKPAGVNPLGTGFTSAVGVKGLSSFFGLKSAPIAGTPAADFDAKLNQVKNDVILPNLTLLHGLGRVTDREFQALTSAVTALSTNQSQGAFRDSLKEITDQINQTAADTGSPTAGILKSPDGTQQVNASDLTPAQLKEAAAAGWK